jgi:carbamoyl-phosphate synthase large subunit
LLIDESLLGWKEYEMEVVRDKRDNCIIVCSIENLDPMGVHTGDSITVAPAQTLTDKEYQILRNASIKVLREIGVETGGSNVQFAINPEDGRMVVIEMNPRVSRSSALASKATGFPIAKIAAKLAVGYTLDELKNDITGGTTPASFEPTIDYVVTKIPRFNFEKFPNSDDTLTTQMKSVGEVMAIGRTFQESFQKALRGLEVGLVGLDPLLDLTDKELPALLSAKLARPSPERIQIVGDAFRAGWSIEQVFEQTKIDPWFLDQISALIEAEQSISDGVALSDINKSQFFALKQQGFSDARISRLLGIDEAQVREYRQGLGVRPVYKRVDTCAAEFSTSTAYLYSTYETSCEAEPTGKESIMILGGGPNRIGQGIEFDYCCVHAALAVRAAGLESIMVNCNPETVSTDYDTSDRLFFEPITLEDVLEIVEIEQPRGVIVHYGGQTPLKLARALEAAGVPIVGTSPDAIDRAEDRERFQQLVMELGLKQPENRTATSVEQGCVAAAEIGYPLVVRPSYVLGGRAMEIVFSEPELRRYFNEAVQVSNESPVLLDRFLSHAVEVDVDAVSDGKQVVVGALMEHIEQAGVHSGDSACSLPPQGLSDAIKARIHEQTEALALALNVVGLMNIQFAIQDGEVYLLEVNPRASRTVPFVSKCIGNSLAQIGALCMLGHSLSSQSFTTVEEPTLISVKEAVFPFAKFLGADPILGPEMKSTGEVMGVGTSFPEAFWKAVIASGESLPSGGRAFISVKDADKPAVAEVAQCLCDQGFSLVATAGTADVLEAAGLTVTRVNKVKEGRPHIVDQLKNEEVQLIINTTEGAQAIADSFEIRRTALQQKVLYTTTLAGARAVCAAMRFDQEEQVRCLQEYHS